MPLSLRDPHRIRLVTGAAVRRATRADAAAVARLLTPLGYPVDAGDVLAVWDAWEAAGDFALVAEADGKLVGVVTLHTMVVLHRPKPVGRITSLAVDPEAQGQGLGRALTEAAEAALRAAGCGLVEVTSHQRRKAAHTFYEHLSYERTSYRFMRPLGSRG